MKNNKGFTLIEVMIVLVILPSMIYGGIVFFQSMYESKKIVESLETKNTMFLSKVILIGGAKDIDDDGHYELLSPGSDQSLPLSIPVSGIDKWGSQLKYHSFDRGIDNSIDNNYAHDGNNTNSEILGAFISLGPDKIRQTEFDDIEAKGDDLLEIIRASEVNFSHGTLGGFFDSGNSVALIDPSNKVVIGTPTLENAKLVVSGDYEADVSIPTNDKSQLSVIGDNPAIRFTDKTSGHEISYMFRTANGEFTLYRATPTSLAWQGVLKIDVDGNVNIQGDLNTSGTIRSSSGNIVFELGE